MQVQPFNPIVDIPYYYPCNFPLIHEVLQRQGSESSLSLLANARLYGLPACSSAGLVKMYFNKLDYADAIWRLKEKRELPSFEAGLAEIRQRIGEGELFLATGNSYYLPYGEDYLNPKYIEKLVEPQSRLYLVDHWLALYGIENERVLVYDPVPSRYTGPLSIQAFHDFWKGNKRMPELAQAKRKEALHTYCSVEIEAEEKLTASSFKAALLRTLATQAHEFLAGQEIREGERTYYFGHAVSLQLLKRLHLGETDGIAALNVISGFVFDMRWSRYFFRDLLQDLAERFGAVYVSYAAEFSEIILQWEQAHKMLQGKGGVSQAAERVNLLRVFVEALIQRESRLYTTLWNAHRSYGIFARSSPQEEEHAAQQRETLERIVMESCRELNQFHQGAIPVELGLQAPLYGRNGNLDSLGLVSLLATVEQGIEEELGIGIALSEALSSALPDSPYRTIDSLVGYLLSHMPKAG